ncbi:MAG: sigma-54-dependent Fis family transcriptional regulator [Firmicutes bacterium]|nr:sigma-54-dependent Fis family transcriptional regulator [Bacillota bacterium]
MSKKNMIVTTEDNQLLYMGEHLYSSVMKHRLSRPFCYASGKIKRGDIFVALFSDAARITADDRKLLENVCGERLSRTGPLIVAGVYEDDSVHSLIKSMTEEAAKQDVWLETVFHGCYLKLMRPGEDAVLQTDSQEVKASLEGGAALAILNESGFLYFTVAENGTEHRVTEILTGAEFEGFWDEERIHAQPVRIGDVLTEEFVSATTGMEEDGSSIIRLGGILYHVQRLTFSSATPRRVLWIVRNEFDVLGELSSHSEVYDMITKADSRKELSGGYTFGLWGNDPKINRIRFLLQKGASTNTTILLTGESGTGKSFLAREIHKCSKREKGTFVSVNCAAIPYNLIESELFGYEEGAFTGARKGGKAGYFEIAEGGTLFLDEITEMPLSLQGKLLEVIQNKTYFRVGGVKKKTADVRIIAATNKDLKTQVREHKFREDLYYRINVFPVEIPPLRERIDSLYNIIADLLPEICERLGVPQQVISQRAMEKMKNYGWPGNIRELENVIEKACILSDGKVILPEDVDLGKNDGILLDDDVRTLKELRDDFEKKVLEDALKRCGGSRLQAAARLDISKTSLFEKLKKYGLGGGEKEEV